MPSSINGRGSDFGCARRDGRTSVSAQKWPAIFSSRGPPRPMFGTALVPSDPFREGHIHTRDHTLERDFPSTVDKRTPVDMSVNSAHFPQPRSRCLPSMSRNLPRWSAPHRKFRA